MIKINKDFTDIPISLRIPDIDSETNEENRITHDFRQRVIERKNYADVYSEDSFVDKRYKTSDIKEKLDKLYPNCGYCEQKLSWDGLFERPTIEHFRPKGTLLVSLFMG